MQCIGASVCAHRTSQGCLFRVVGLPIPAVGCESPHWLGHIKEVKRQKGTGMRKRHNLQHPLQASRLSEISVHKIGYSEPARCFWEVLSCCPSTSLEALNGWLIFTGLSRFGKPLVCSHENSVRLQQITQMKTGSARNPSWICGC